MFFFPSFLLQLRIHIYSTLSLPLPTLSSLSRSKQILVNDLCGNAIEPHELCDEAPDVMPQPLVETRKNAVATIATYDVTVEYPKDPLPAGRDGRLDASGRVTIGFRCVTQGVLKMIFYVGMGRSQRVVRRADVAIAPRAGAKRICNAMIFGGFGGGAGGSAQAGRLCAQCACLPRYQYKCFLCAAADYNMTTSVLVCSYCAIRNRDACVVCDGFLGFNASFAGVCGRCAMMSAHMRCQAPLG